MLAKNRQKRVDEPIVVNSVHDGQRERDEKNSSIHRRKDIDSDNKSEVSYDNEGDLKADARSGIRKHK